MLNSSRFLFAVLVALSLSSFVGVANVEGAALSKTEIWFKDSVIGIGGTTSILARPTEPTDGNSAWIFVTNGQPGSTTVTVQGVTVTLPYAAVTFVASGTLSDGMLTTPYTVAKDESLINTELFPIGIWFEDGDPVIAAAGGPIIIDDIA